MLWWECEMVWLWGSSFPISIKSHRKKACPQTQQFHFWHLILQEVLALTAAQRGSFEGQACT